MQGVRVPSLSGQRGMLGESGPAADWDLGPQRVISWLVSPDPWVGSVQTEGSGHGPHAPGGGQAMVPTHRAGVWPPGTAPCARPEATLVPNPSAMLPGAALFSLPLGVTKHPLLVHL